MRRYPKERDCFFENEVPLHVPVHRLHDLSHRNRREEPFEAASRRQNVRVGYFMERHEDRREDGVHRSRNGECHTQFLPREWACHEGSGLFYAQIGDESGYACRKDDEGEVDAHTENTPYQGAGEDAEAGFVVIPGADTQSDQFTDSGEDGKFDETHPHAMRRIQRFISFVNGFAYTKRK